MQEIAECPGDRVGLFVGEPGDLLHQHPAVCRVTFAPEFHGCAPQFFDDIVGRLAFAFFDDFSEGLSKLSDIVAQEGGFRTGGVWLIHQRSEERRVGNKCVSTFSSCRWTEYLKNK